jgi:excisionase family DNA binding protein
MNSTSPLPYPLRKLADEKLLTAAEVAALYRVDVKSVTRWAKQGKLPHVTTPGGRRRYREADIRAVYEAGGGVWPL